MSRTTIPLKQRKEMSKNPFYKVCALKGFLDHECGGSITWEHSIIYAGKSLQAIWSIVPLCSKAHAVNEFQDAGTMNKELNVWIALNRASEDDLLLISKAENYIQKKERLNAKYGVWKPLIKINIPQ